MPLLQFDITGPLTREDKEAFVTTVTELYTEHMATTAGHVAVSIRGRDPGDLSLGRAVEGRLCFLDAEIRRGRSEDRKRAFALTTMAAAGERWEIPNPNMNVAFGEHAGNDMMGVDRVGAEWTADREEN